MQSQEIRMSLSGHGKRTLRISQVDSNIQYFKKAMEEVGILLKLDDSQTVLTQEQSLVIRDIDKFLKTDMIMNKVQKFISGFKITCKQEGYFRKLLLPTVLQKHISEDENEALSSKINQESVFRILLNVSCLQTEIIEILLNEITTHAGEECSDSSLLRLLLNAVRYLPFIKEPDILTQKLLDVLDIATFTSQLEILNYIPEIIPDCHYDETAKQLIKLLDENADLTGAIIDCLNSFNLSLDTRANVQEYILPRLASTSAKMYFPVLFEFLITDCKPQQLPHILLKTRDALQIIMNNEVQDKNAESYMVIICNKIRITSVIKAVYDGWINIITNIRSFNSGQKPIDLLILFILHSSGTNRKKQIEALFKKKVKMSLFRTSHLEVMFQKYLVRQILHNHLPSIIEIATSLLMNNEVTSNEFANAIYKLVFTNAHIERTQRQDLLHSLMLLTGSSEMKNVYPILNILTELSSDPKLQQHTLQLMGLLEKLDTFDLQDCRQLFELLCTLICGQNADDSSLKNEIHMLIQKQLSSGKKVIKQRGIVSSVVMAKHIATTLEDQSALDLADESLTNISNLPTGPPQESAGLLELASTCSSGTPELLGLYYDQLANIIMYADNIDKYFMTWLFESITQDFQDIFVIEKIPVESINDIKLESLFSLNTAEETDIIISINIAELTLEPSCARSSILILAPIFRLLRLLHSKHHNGDLATIDALLGCGIIMPNIADIESYDSYQMKQVSDCIFHCINWFREIISAFVTQTNKKLRLKVIERLNQLIELEELLHKTMEHIPDHKLPTCNFYNTSLSSNKSSPTKSESKISRPKKKFKSNELTATNLNDTALTSASVSTQATKQPVKKVNADPSYNFREMDTDLIILIKYPLNLDDEVVVSETQQTKLEPEALQFILKDFIFKLNGLTKKKNIKCTNMIIDPLNLITDCTKLLPSINKHLEVIVNNISQILKETEFQMDHSGMYTPKSQSFKTLFGLILECLSLIFDWSGFQQPKHLNLLKECLKALRNECSSQLYSATQLTKEFINKLYGYTDYCLYLHSAVSLVKIMQSLSSIIDNNSDVYKKIALTSEKLLTKKWYNLSGNREGGKQAFENIEMLLKAYLTGANVKTIYELVATLQTQANNLKSKDDYLPMLGSIDKSSFHVFYRCLCSFLLERVKYEVGSLTNNEHIVLWRTTALTMQGLMTIVKVQEMRTNFCIFLKKSIGILKVFLSHGVPVLEIMLKSKTDEVVEILKTMQTSTRFLHHLCCYSKIKKDASLMANVPQFRLTLETFVFRVKAALVANDCSSAFWLGTLKNRDLQGDDISSQSTVTSEEAIPNGNSDEELPINDDDDDEDIVNETDDREDGTASEIYD